MHVVLESGHKNAGDAERVFHELKAELAATGSNLLATITFAGKEDSDPLMVADYLAHGTLMLERAEPERVVGRHERDIPAPLRRGTGMTELKFHRDGLIGMKAELVNRARRRRTEDDPSAEQIPPPLNAQPC